MRRVALHLLGRNRVSEPVRRHGMEVPDPLGPAPILAKMCRLPEPGLDDVPQASAQRTRHLLWTKLLDRPSARASGEWAVVGRHWYMQEGSGTRILVQERVHLAVQAQQSPEPPR